MLSTHKDNKRPSARQRGYDARWEKARAVYLAAHPLCCMCERLGRVTAATVVDHIQPHKGSDDLFWDEGNWQSLCKPCHDQHKQRQEKGGGVMGCDVNGIPIDPAHHWK